MIHGKIASDPAAAGTARTLPLGVPVAALVVLLGADNLLVPRFLGLATWPGAMIGAIVVAGIAAACGRAMPGAMPWRRLGWCLGIGLAVMLLGGEGRLFYANVDWQTRDASLADLVRWPWPFAYGGHGAPLLPRFPLGMYLLPALAGKAGGQNAADLALLGQNGVVLGLVLALGSALGAGVAARRRLLAVALGFGGLDVLGMALLHPDRLLPLTRNIEGWGPTIYQSHLGQAYWAPHHALAAWVGAVLFLLWRTGRAPLAVLLAVLPLLAIWSPLAVMGLLPFAALAAIDTLRRRALRVADMALPALALAVALVPLRFLAADAARVGFGIDRIPPLPYLLFVALEVGPCLLGVALGTRGGRFGAATLLVTAACLLAFPFVAAGESVDFAMRASAPALAVLAAMAADLLGERPGAARSLAIAALAVGTAAPLRDTLRAIAFRPSPPPLCDFARAWDQSFARFGKQTYLARLSAVPPAIRPAHPFLAPPVEPPRCWARPWARPRWPAAARWLGP